MVKSRRKRALLSVTDKEGLVELARVLDGHGYELVASGGTAGALRDAGLTVVDVATVTGQPEILGGRVKTLHPAMAAGILAPSPQDLNGTGFDPIDVVVVNLYDFYGAVADNRKQGDLVEAIDIGGPTLLRAAAKNFDRVTVLPDPGVYREFARELDEGRGSTRPAFRRRMAGRVFELTSRYDAAIAGGLFDDTASAAVSGSPRHPLRYGENPHQGAWWSVENGQGLEDLGLSRHGGKELSYNNLLDLIAAQKLASDLPVGGCAILKHTNPCGVGVGTSPHEALARAFACDPVSAFGGIVALRDTVDGDTAGLIAERFLEVVVAPDFDATAREVLAKKKNLRWLSVDAARFAQATSGSQRRWGNLVLSQEEDEGFPELERWQLAVGDAPSEETLRAAELAWRVSKHVKSNAIVLGDANGTLGIGAGQMSRVDSCRLAVRKASDQGHDLKNTVAASDGFFPFADGLELLAEAGVTTVVQPGGSIRDTEVADAATRLGVTLFLTGVRHFRH